MALAEARTLHLAESDLACWWCHDTGVRQDGADCTCDARPFRDVGDIPPVSAPVGPIRLVELSPEAPPLLAGLELGVDVALSWSGRVIRSLVALAEFVPHLDHPFARSVAADRALFAADSLSEAADDLFEIVDLLRSTAQAIKAETTN
jgi:hypothetical protein